LEKSGELGFEQVSGGWASRLAVVALSKGCPHRRTWSPAPLILSTRVHARPASFRNRLGMRAHGVAVRIDWGRRRSATRGGGKGARTTRTRQTEPAAIRAAIPCTRCHSPKNCTCIRASPPGVACWPVATLQSEDAFASCRASVWSGASSSPSSGPGSRRAARCVSRLAAPHLREKPSLPDHHAAATPKWDRSQFDHHDKSHAVGQASISQAHRPLLRQMGPLTELRDHPPVNAGGFVGFARFCSGPVCLLPFT